jgi:two-component system, OmpR family, sensor kinase
MRALPLRIRLTLTFALGMAVVLGALGWYLHASIGRDLLDSIDMGLRSRTQVILSVMDQGSVPGNSGELIDPDESFAQVLDPTASPPIVDSSPAVAHAPMVPISDLPRFSGPTFQNRRVTGVEDPARLLVVPVTSAGHTQYVVAGATLSDRQEALDGLLAELAIGAPLALVVTSYAGWVVAGLALRPVERIRAEAAAISASEPERRLPVPPGNDELARLASTLNVMLDRLQEALSRERRIVDDASHELRTPLTILKGELELALARARTADELEAALRRASAETDRLARLADDLLVLARADGGRVPLSHTDVSLASLVQESCEAMRPRARDAGVSLDASAPDDIIRIDPVRLRQAISNLIDNALRHTSPGGRIQVIGERDDGQVRIVVEDPGTGFSPSVLRRAFEPFARGDGDGAGLGLAIVRAVAQSHGGDATAENLPGGGARVTLTLPS